MNRLKLSAAALLLAFGIPALAAVPQVSPEMKANAETMWQDAVFQKMYDELKSEEGQKWRFNTLMELVRIASPSRLELRRQQEMGILPLGGPPLEHRQREVPAKSQVDRRTGPARQPRTHR